MGGAGKGASGRSHRVDPGVLLAEAATLHGEGDAAGAERICRRILSLDPDQVGALHLAGMIAAEAGRPAEAVELLDRAIDLEGEVPAFHYALARAFEVQGRTTQALLHRGNGLRAEGRLSEAADCYWQVLAQEPDLPAAFAHLGDTLLAGGDAASALSLYQQALIRRPGYVVAELGVGHALAAEGQEVEAVDHYKRVITLDPHNAEAPARLGRLYHRLGDHDEAISWFDKALALRPALAMAHYGLGLIQAERGLLAVATGHFRAALTSRPGWAEASLHLGIALQHQGAATEAVSAFRRALARDPALVQAQSRLVTALVLDDTAPSTERAAEARRFAEVRTAGLARPAPDHRNQRDPGRRLRIGYVSADLRRSSVAPFLEPLLAHHDRRQVEVTCYAEVAHPDLMSSRFKGMVDHWVDAVGVSDEELARRLEADGVDILVDLTGHRPGNRLLVFARQPAPVQVSWLGCGEATGLPAIGWRLTDVVVDPVAADDDGLAFERPVRLARGSRCWQPPSEAPPVVMTPTNTHLTFGSLAGLSALSPAVVATWAALLRRVPKARLLLSGRALADRAVVAAVRARFADHRIAADRLDLLGGATTAAARLALYGRIDVALDPFPASVPAALCEALWMGVPVVTLAGDRPAGRIGASLLTHAGLDRLIADSVDRYIAIAATLADEPHRRSNWRKGLRAHLAGSAICDGPGLARGVEAAYRALWRHWCG